MSRCLQGDSRRIGGYLCWRVSPLGWGRDMHRPLWRAAGWTLARVCSSVFSQGTAASTKNKLPSLIASMETIGAKALEDFADSIKVSFCLPPPLPPGTACWYVSGDSSESRPAGGVGLPCGETTVLLVPFQYPFASFPPGALRGWKLLSCFLAQPLRLRDILTQTGQEVALRTD